MKQPCVWFTAVCVSLLVWRCDAANFNQTISTKPELSNVTAYLAAFPSVVDLLESAQNITFLAPTNKAFASFLNSSEANLPGSILWDYHILDGTGLFSEAAILQTLLNDSGYTTLTPGAVVKFNPSDNAQGAQKGNLLSGLGIQAALGNRYQFDGGDIHEIDTVLQIPLNTSATRHAISQLSDTTAFDVIVPSTDKFTIFLPSTTAWDNSVGSNSALSSDDLRKLVLSHIVQFTVHYSTDEPATIMPEAGNQISVGPGGGSSLNQSFAYVLADIPLYNGVLHVIDKVFNPFNSTQQAGAGAATSSSSPQNPSSTNGVPGGTPAGTGGSSGLSTGAKAGIGVAVPLGVIAIAAIAFFFFFRRKKRNYDREPSKAAEAPNNSVAREHEKPELVGGPYDPAIAGPVKRKGELEPTSSAMSERPNASELAGPMALAHRTDSHELSTSESVRRAQKYQKASSSEGTATTVAGSEAPLVSDSSKHPQSPTSATAGPELQPVETQDELTEEADTLVSELGVITKRKKALTVAAAAAGTGTKPEDVPGRKGEEFRELVEREQRVRGRMEDVQKALGQR